MAKKITLEIELEDSMLSDIMCTAIEGGIGYWCEARKIERNTDESLPLTYLSFHAFDAEEGTPFDPLIVTLDTIAEGVAALLNPSSKVNDSIRFEVFDAAVSNEAWMIDADAADAIVQFGMFGEIVYG